MYLNTQKQLHFQVSATSHFAVNPNPSSIQLLICICSKKLCTETSCPRQHLLRLHCQPSGINLGSAPSPQLPDRTTDSLPFEAQMNEFAAVLGGCSRLQGCFWIRKCLVLSVVPAWLSDWMQTLASAPFPVEGAEVFPKRTLKCLVLAHQRVNAIASCEVSVKKKTYTEIL